MEFLCNLTANLTTLPTGIGEDADFIRRELLKMRTQLSNAEHRGEKHRPKLAEYAMAVRELAYDAEDFIDEFRLRSENDGHGGFFHKSINLFANAKSRHRIAKELGDLKSRVMKVKERFWSHVITTDGAASSTSSAAVPPPADVSTLIGIDGPRNEVVKLLTKDPESASRLKVVSIVGAGGMGKTTLAREVYRTTQAHFHCRAWVSMSPTPDMKKLLIHILDQVEDPHSGLGCEGGEHLIRKIRASLQDKRYLIVLDDIWSSETWEIIKSAFLFNNLGSRIITTTRNNQVAASCCSNWNDHIYPIRPLSLEDSRMLFGRVFSSVDHCPSELERVFNRIAEKCSGVPLALTVMSGFLAKKPLEISIWESVYDSIDAAPKSMESIRDMLLLGYDDLPHNLKMCFLYLSIFPADYAINRNRIVRSWIAEGFIQGNNGTSLEEIAESYVNELINRNMIQAARGSNDGKPEAFQIHRLMLDLIKYKSMEENFATIIYNREPVSLLHRKIRRLSIISGSEDNCIPASMDMSYIRSLYIFGGVMPKRSFKHLTLLRVLNLEGCKDLPDRAIEDISGFLHLRYLSIRETPISKIPVQIGRLQYLITLDLRGTDVQELPSSVVHLQRLEHLLCDKIMFPEGIGKMAALSYLSQLDILRNKVSVVKELGNLSQLRELVLWWFPDMVSNNTYRYKPLAISLYKLNKLQSLSIHGGNDLVDFFNYLPNPLGQLRRIQLNRSCYLSRIPEWFGSLAMLTYACIDVKEARNGDLQLLSALPSLLHLSLSSRDMPTEKIVIRSNGFPVIQEFHLHYVRPDLKIEPNAMQKLEILLLSVHVLPEEPYGFSIIMNQFRCLKKFDIEINGNDAAAYKFFEATDVAIKRAAHGHPNNPVVSVIPLGNMNDYAVKEGKEKEREMGNLIAYAVKEGKENEQDIGNFTGYAVKEGKEKEQDIGNFTGYAMEGKETEQNIGNFIGYARRERKK